MSSCMPVSVIHWITPIAVGTSFTLAKLFAVCTLQKPSRTIHAAGKVRRSLSVVLSSIVTLLFVAQVIFYLWLRSHGLGPHDVPQDLQFYIGGSIFAWSLLTVNIVGNRKRIWYPYVAAWIVASLLEILEFFFKASTEYEKSYPIVDPGLHAGRIVCMVLLSINGSCLSSSCHVSRHKVDEETQPLLPSSCGRASEQSSSISSDDDCGGSDVSLVDDEESERTKELRKKQRRRLEECGSWMAYLKDFKVLMKLAWPSGDRTAQVCLLMVVLVILAVRALNLLVPRQLGIITDRLMVMHETGEVPLKEIGLWMLYVWLGSYAGLRAIAHYCRLPIEQHAYVKVGTTAFDHIMNLSMDFHNDKHSGELMATIDQGQQLYDLVDFVFLRVGPMMFDLVIALAYITYAFDVSIALVVVLVGAGYTYVGARATSWAMIRRRHFNKAWRNESKIQNESISNWQTISHFNMTGYECSQYAKAVGDHASARSRYSFVNYTGSAAQNVLLLLGQLSAALLAAYRVSRGTVPVGSFITLMTYWSTIEVPLTSVSLSIRELSQMLIDSERLLELLRTEPSVIDLPDAKPLRLVQGRVEYDKVCFSYDVRKASLQGVCFVAEAGKTIALVGETGGGKSTILKLLFRYYDISGGSIRIDGQDIRQVTLSSLRGVFGMVPQDPSLFNQSIMDNVRYARLEATDDEVMEACRAAAIHDRIVSFPDGYSSTVGERGVKLSGGELQRIAIARAILRNPQIVLLDEATSMVDAETEASIQKAFEKLTAGRTTFVVAHRLSTIQHADLILVIQNGQIVERGTHEELYALNGKYTRLWSRQLAKQTENQSGDGPQF